MHPHDMLSHVLSSYKRLSISIKRGVLIQSRIQDVERSWTLLPFVVENVNHKYGLALAEETPHP